jgi:hypothetical protein
MLDKMKKGAFLLMLAGLAVAILTGSPAGAQPVRSAPAGDRIAAPAFAWEDWDAPKFVILYNQLDNPGADDLSSQNFEAVYDAYDSFGGDDVVIPANTQWTIQGVGVTGTYGNCLPGCAADSFTVTFHADNGGVPKDPPVLIRPNQTYTVDPAGSTCLFPERCLFKIPITPQVVVPAAPVARHGWLSVQANMDFGTDGQFFWTDRAVQSNSAAAWKNPSDGFLTGCVNWSPMTGCLGVVAPDFTFAIVGLSTP